MLWAKSGDAEIYVEKTRGSNTFKVSSNKSENQVLMLDEELETKSAYEILKIIKEG